MEKEETKQELNENVSTKREFIEKNADIYKDKDEWIATNEFLCGTFAGRAFVGKTKYEAINKLIEYFNEHIGHKSIVGMCVDNSIWKRLK